MALGPQGERQPTMYFTYDQIPRSPGHAFYDELQKILCRSGFDRFVEKICKPYYAERGRPSIPPGRYFRMHLVGYFEGIDSERGIEWRCADSLSLRNFLRLNTSESVPDHSTLSRTRARLPLEVHQEVFTWILKVIAKSGLLLGGQIGVDASTMEANAALKSIVRRDTGENYQQMLLRMAKESGMDSPTSDDLKRMDRKRKGKKLSNQDWESTSDPQSKITKMKDGRTHLAYKPEHAVDLNSGAIVAVEIHPADEGDTKTLHKTLQSAEENLKKATPTPPKLDDPAELIADKGYFSREVLKSLEDGPWKTRISEPKAKGLYSWKGDHEARRAVYNNRARIGSKKGKQALRDRTEVVERSFEHTLDRGGMRRTWLRGCENIQKRYLVHVCGFNLGLLIRTKHGFGTPKGWAGRPDLLVFGVTWGPFKLILVVLPLNSESVVIFPVMMAVMNDF
jgi:transposase